MNFTLIVVIVSTPIAAAILWLHLYRAAYQRRLRMRSAEATQRGQSAIDIYKNLQRRIESEAITLLPTQPKVTVPDNTDVRLAAGMTNSSENLANQSILGTAIDSGLIGDSLASIGHATQDYFAVTDNFVSAIRDYAHDHALANDKSLTDYLHDLAGRQSDYPSVAWLYTNLEKGHLAGIKGHLGEYVVGAQLSDAGRTVDFPNNGSQKGWDILLDGKPVQIKTGGDFSNVTKHLTEYPDIPVLFNGDMENIPPQIQHIDFDNLNGLSALNLEPGEAVALDGFSNGVTEAATKSGVDGATGSGNTFHIPVFTVLTSGWREINLLVNNETDIGSAAKNIAIDAAGQGVGTAFGGKAGGLLGSLAGPIGIAVGTSLGSLIGAAIGRYLSNEIKMDEANEAHKNLRQSVSQLENEISQGKIALSNNVDSERAAADTAFCKFQTEQQASFDRMMSTLKDDMERDNNAVGKQLIALARKEIIESEGRPVGFWTLISPTKAGQRKAERDWTTSVKQSIDKAEESDSLNMAISTITLVEISPESYEPILSGHCERARVRMAKCTLTTKRLAQRSISFQQSLSRQVVTNITAFTEQLSEKLRSRIEAAIRQSNTAITEFGKVGLKNQTVPIQKLIQHLEEIQRSLLKAGESAKTKAA